MEREQARDWREKQEREEGARAPGLLPLLLLLREAVSLLSLASSPAAWESGLQSEGAQPRRWQRSSQPQRVQGSTPAVDSRLLIIKRFIFALFLRKICSSTFSPHPPCLDLMRALLSLRGERD